MKSDIPGRLSPEFISKIELNNYFELLLTIQIYFQNF